MIARGRLSPTKEVTGGRRATTAQESGASASSCGREADCASAREPGRPNEVRSRRERARGQRNRRAKAVSAQRLSADSPEHHRIAAERSVRVFLRSRSRPQRPRTGSLSAAKSAGTGQRRSTKCRRGGPVAAQRSSGLPRRQDREPHRGGRAREARRPEGRSKAERSPALTDDGDREGGPGRKARQAVHQAGRERRRGATPATATLAAYQTDQ
jgi:hypothetical protein